MNEIKKKLGKKIKYYRELKGLTQEELAEKLDFNCRSLSFIECGTNFVTADTLEKLCNELSVTPKQLLILNIIH
ncbi:MAG: helix-turn-helix domain-containing protein [Candidatus Gastranaerophilaceae bacterium]